MKKIFSIIILFSIALSLSSCFKDLGNYDYKEKEVITITGVEAIYNAVQMVDKLNITPTVTSNIPGAQFEYYYTIYETNVQNDIPTLDTIQKGSSKDLVNYTVTRKSMTYGLVFMAKNKTTGVVGFKNATLNVVTKFNDGWYIIKDQSNITDLDLYDNTGKLLVENVLLSVNGRQLKGKAQAISVAINYKVINPVTGSFANTKTIFPVSDNDAKAVILSTAVIAKDFKDMFYDVMEEPYAPTRFFGTNMGLWTTNKGRAYSIYAMSSNTGIFGVEAPIDINYSPYHLSKYTVNHSMFGPLAYDETSSTFVLISSTSGNQLVATKNANGSNMSVKNNNKNLLYMGSRGLYSSYFFAVMQDKTDANIKFISKVEGFSGTSGPTLKFSNDTLATSDLAFNATMYHSNQTLDILYFVTNNIIYMRNVAAKGAANVQLAYTPAAGETVTFIKHIPNYSTYYPNNTLVVGTQSATKYKVRVFVLTSLGNVTPDPIFTFEGNGRAADILFAFPNIGNTTFPCTY